MTATNYEVLSVRQVPFAVKGVTIVTRRVVETPLIHGGQMAVYVRVASGFSAWGFGDTREEAEKDAVAKAFALS